MKYLVLQPDEDGNPVRIVTKDQLNTMLGEMQRCHGSVKVRTGEYDDAGYWAENEMMIFELGDQVTPKIKLSV